MNQLSLHSQPLKYSTDQLDRPYVDQCRALKTLIGMYFPNLKAEKRANPPANETLAAELDAADELLKACVTNNEREVVCKNIFKNATLADLISLAKTGHVATQYFLAIHVDKSYAGLKWLNKAANQCNPNAMYLLFLTNRNVPLLRASAECGHVGAKITLLYRDQWDKNDVLGHLMDAYQKGNREDDLFKYLGKVSEKWGDYNSALNWYGQMASVLDKEAHMHAILNRAPWDAT